MKIFFYTDLKGRLPTDLCVIGFSIKKYFCQENLNELNYWFKLEESDSLNKDDENE